VTNHSLAEPIRQLLPALFLLLTCALAAAQGGGKAEPLRIEFKHGTNSTTINGKVRGSEEAEYVLAAKKGQRLIITMTSAPRRSSCFDLHGPEGVDVGLEYDCNMNYTRTLPKTGDYLISVVRTTSSPGSSTYKLIITVR
jgi:hypothetical protein